MALWLVRAGARGEFEKKFLDESRVYLTWGELSRGLRSFNDRHQLIEHMKELWPETGDKKLINHASQIWPFGHEMKVGDWIVLPSKLNATIHIGEITGDYVNVPEGPDPFFHYRPVKWLRQDEPKSSFKQDLLYSMGAFMTICRIARNDAEKRVREVVERGPQSGAVSTPPPEAQVQAEDQPIDLAEFARQEIAQQLIRRYKGHDLAALVGAILRAQGYSVLVTPPGPDRGVDILAAPGPLGFGEPKLCVQVKCSEGQCDSDTLMKLIGSMSHVGASHGLLVSWGGFKSSIRGEMERARFFSVRLWGQDELIEEMLSVYDMLDADIRTELPLKRIWTIARSEEDL
jgi:restriction system protein